MANDNQLPLQVSGPLPKKCYADMNEFVKDLAKVLELPLDTAVIIKGAEGPRGQKGEKGNRGDIGPPGDSKTLTRLEIPILSGMTYVEFNYFTGWQVATYTIRNINSIANALNPFLPVNGVVGVGTVVSVYAIPTPTKLRCYFTFAGGITETPDNTFILQISILQ